MKTICALSLLTTLFIFPGCGSDEVDSDADARRAYLGFDPAIDRAIELGLDGFNAATSANIPEQSGDGDEVGTMLVSGQVDQGASANKEMRLLLELVGYSDGAVLDVETDETVSVVYDSPLDTPLPLDISLRNIPNGTFTGTIIGDLLMSGDVDSAATFDLVLSGEIAEDTTTGNVLRVPGTLVITGTVTSGEGTFDVNVSR